MRAKEHYISYFNDQFQIINIQMLLFKILFLRQDFLIFDSILNKFLLQLLANSLFSSTLITYYSLAEFP